MTHQAEADQPDGRGVVRREYEGLADVVQLRRAHVDLTAREGKKQPCLSRAGSGRAEGRKAGSEGSTERDLSCAARPLGQHAARALSSYPVAHAERSGVHAVVVMHGRVLVVLVHLGLLQYDHLRRVVVSKDVAVQAGAPPDVAEVHLAPAAGGDRLEAVAPDEVDDRRVAQPVVGPEKDALGLLLRVALAEAAGCRVSLQLQ